VVKAWNSHKANRVKSGKERSGKKGDDKTKPFRSFHVVEALCVAVLLDKPATLTVRDGVKEVFTKLASPVGPKYAAWIPGFEATNAQELQAALKLPESPLVWVWLKDVVAEEEVKAKCAAALAAF